MTDPVSSAAAAPNDAATTSSAADTTTTAGTSLLAAGGDAATTQQPSDATAATAVKDGAEAGGKPAGSETAAKGAPESYADFKVPEGVQLDPDLATEFGTLAKGLDLSQEDAQKVVDVAAKLATKASEAQAAQVQSIHSDWVQQTKTDPEIGGEKLAENLARANAAMKATTTPQLQMLLDKSGLGNHPEVIRHFLKIAPAFAPDTFVPGGKAPAGAGKSAAEVLYDSTPKG